jgi:hypothetical protein
MKTSPAGGSIRKREVGSVWLLVPGWNGSMDVMVLDGMVQVEHLISCTSKLYEMVHNFVWLDK